jgi:iron complex transport system ATP-binding protein
VKIETSDLTVSYPDADRPAVDAVSMRVPAGTFYAVLGPNGSGKSSLMRALLGVLPVSGGRALLDGLPAGEWERRALARAVGAVSQSESIAFPLTTTELVGMGRYPHLGALEAMRTRDREAIAHALEVCDLTGLAHRDVTTLSGGEFQRARIARALCQEPRALVLDEPTASLDIRHQMAILQLLRTSADDGITVLLVTHSLDRAAQFADRLLLMSEGRVAAEGPPAAVMTSEILTRVYGWPVSVETDERSGSLRVTPVRPTVDGECS